jgi:hypothetical protein
VKEEQSYCSDAVKHSENDEDSLKTDSDYHSEVDSSILMREKSMKVPHFAKSRTAKTKLRGGKL